MHDFEKKYAGWFFELLAPALIMLLIGSLVFFSFGDLVRRTTSFRTRIVLAWWVFGSVLVCRISVTEGRERSIIFGGVLALAVLLSLSRFATLPHQYAPFAIFIHIGFIALTWWCASRLVWDCTVVETSNDASNEGLLERFRSSEPDDDSTAHDHSDNRSAAAETGEEGIYGSTSEEQPANANSPIQYFSMAGNDGAQEKYAWFVGALFFDCSEFQFLDWGRG